MGFSRFWASLRYRLVETPWARSLRAGLRAPAAHNPVERNIWYLYVEVLWAAILSAAAAFNATFAVRLGASNQMIGWLSSVPALLAVFLYIPAARFLERRARRTPWIWGSLFLARVGYGLIVMLPWVIPAQYQGAALVWLLIAISVPSTFFATGFNPLLADVIPERDRARVFANRNIINGMVVATLTFLAGRWLDRAAQIDWATFPRNFQILYVIGFLGAATSSWYLLKIKVPDSKVIAPEPQEHGAHPRPAQIIANARRFVADNRGFVRITANTLAFGFGDWLLAPVYTIFFLRHLGASDGWVGLNSTLANVGVIVGYTLWRKWIEQLGHNRTLLITIPLSACYPFLVSLFPNLTLILIWGIFINLINPGVNLSHFNILLKLCPDERRASYIATYSAIMNAGAFIGPLIGVALADWLDIRWVLVIGGCFRLLGAGLFHLFKVQVKEAASAEAHS
ncbi:MAG TPA: MFS transporter [Anaerolineae bacterium]|nr:MFS transporter [Anaerolineae bacterium]